LKLARACGWGAGGGGGGWGGGPDNRRFYSSGVTKYSSQMTNNFIRAMPNFSPEETIQ